ncbi:MAG TPA: L,D-transpeptidase [Miltoncostaeaceae bacterium]|jgi:lipoprotein-anchoring transpeptidase ErfK/SrfK|nr:L,D-transpeptidase [Miltoncostaeaceae bacterium]
MRLARRAAVLSATLAAAGALPAGAAAQAPPGLHVASWDAPSAVTQGTRAEVSGRVAPAAAVPVTVERLENGAWAPLVTLRSDRRGRFAAALPLRTSSSLRVSVATAEGTVASSRRRSVALRRRVTVKVTAAPMENISGRPFTVTGSLGASAKGERLQLQGSVGGKRFRTLKTLATKGGRIRATFTPPSGGKWRFRLTAAPTAGRDVGGRATTGAMSVYGANPHGVPAGASHYLVQEISQTLLYYYEDGKLRRVFPVVFGKPSTPTPVGRFAVYSKTAGPSAAFGPLVLWYHRGYGIHGTNQEYLLSRSWRYYSHGCTRNYNANILWLWPRVPVGTPVINLR